MGPYNLLT